MKGHFSVLKWVRLDDPQAAQALLNPDDKKFATAFAGDGISATEAARRLGMRVDTLLYRVQRWLDLGLLEIASVARGRGRPSKRYRLIADGFVVPFHTTQFETLLDLFLKQDVAERERLGRGLIQSVVGEGGGWHVRLYHEPNSRLWHWEAAPDHDPDWRQEQLLQPGSPAAWYTYSSLLLTSSEAKQLQQDLVTLYMRYAAKEAAPSQDAKLYTLQLGLGPCPGKAGSPL
ncbi:hypothetical protein [Deinococcus aestuarii]|uniref:hypothetical protein n=1 Tax=Deinococcus aestuarii TaxID=2774531 RepID=UPI001C0E5053|nr:hypothetical protein [Deinococcus aestuarii]